MQDVQRAVVDDHVVGSEKRHARVALSALVEARRELGRVAALLGEIDGLPPGLERSAFLSLSFT